MPLESATYIADLVATNPVTTDEISQGDDHIRLLKSVLQTQFPSLGDAAVTGTAAQLNRATGAFSAAGVLEVPANGGTGGELVLDGPATSGAVLLENTTTAGNPGVLTIQAKDGTNANASTAATLTRAGAFTATASVNAPSIQKGGNELLPTGVICMWSGSVGSIPAGWHLCDGTTGTPDLRGMFILGAGGSYAPAQTGGAASVTPTTAAAGTHSHTGLTVAAGGHSHTGTTDSQGAHSHGGSDGAYALQIGDMPAHDHGGLSGFYVVCDASLQGPGTGQAVGAGPFPAAELRFSSQGSNNAHSHTISSDGAHNHNLSINAVGDHQHAIVSDGNHTHSVTVATMPPYYALAFIMKL